MIRRPRVYNYRMKIATRKCVLWDEEGLRRDRCRGQIVLLPVTGSVTGGQEIAVNLSVATKCSVATLIAKARVVERKKEDDRTQQCEEGMV